MVATPTAEQTAPMKAHTKKGSRRGKARRGFNLGGDERRAAEEEFSNDVICVFHHVRVRFGTYLRVLFRSHFCWRHFVFRRLEFRTRVLLYPRRNLKGADKFKQEHGLSIALGRGLPSVMLSIWSYMIILTTVALLSDLEIITFGRLKWKLF